MSLGLGAVWTVLFRDEHHFQVMPCGIKHAISAHAVSFVLSVWVISGPWHHVGNGWWCMLSRDPVLGDDTEKMTLKR